MKIEYLGDGRIRTEDGEEHWIERDFEGRPYQVHCLNGIEFREGIITFSEMKRLSKLATEQNG